MASPWLKFYPTDWQSDPALRMCSLAARGLWADMLCLMHKAYPYGSLVVNGIAITPKQLAMLCGAPAREVEACLQELEASGVFSRDENGTIYSRRMRRDFLKAERDKANGKGGGNPKIVGGVKGGVNPPPNPQGGQGVKAQSQKPEARDSPLPSVAPPNRRERGQRLPADWQPTAADIEFAAAIRIDLQREIPKFRDYWHARAGPGGVKIDWSATWRNWCRKAAESNSGKANGHGKRTVIDAANDLVAKINALDGPAETGSGAGAASPRMLPQN